MLPNFYSSYIGQLLFCFIMQGLHDILAEPWKCFAFFLKTVSSRFIILNGLFKKISFLWMNFEIAWKGMVITFSLCQKWLQWMLFVFKIIFTNLFLLLLFFLFWFCFCFLLFFVVLFFLRGGGWFEKNMFVNPSGEHYLKICTCLKNTPEVWKFSVCKDCVTPSF